RAVSGAESRAAGGPARHWRQRSLSDRGKPGHTCGSAGGQGAAPWGSPWPRKAGQGITLASEGGSP
ncbi:hypothetical protein P7K49_008554, partial [Saguinus oedipus]